MGTMKYFCIFAALWHAGSSIALPGSNSYAAISARSENPNNRILPSRQNLAGEASPKRDAAFDHLGQPRKSGIVIPSQDTKKSTDQPDSKRPGFPNTAPGSFMDYQGKDFPSRISHNWASHQYPPIKESKSPDNAGKSAEPGSEARSDLTRRSAADTFPLPQSANHGSHHLTERSLKRRGYSPFWPQRPSNGKKPQKKETMVKGSDTPLERPRNPRVRFQLRENMATRSSQPQSHENQRRHGMDLGSSQSSDGNDISSREAPIRSVFETSAYFKNSWRPLPKEKSPPPPDKTSNSATDAKHIGKRSTISPRTAAPGREVPPKTPSPVRNANSPTRFPNIVPPNSFRPISPQSVARNPAAEEAMSNAAARARQASQYPRIDHYLAGGRIIQPARSSRPSTYPIIPAVPPLRGSANGAATAYSSDSDSPRTSS